MDDYYELLAIDPSWSPTEIDAHLLSLNRRYRTRSKPPRRHDSRGSRNPA